MKRNAISSTLTVLALASAALFAGGAQADSARLSVSFGDFYPPVWGVSSGDHHYDWSHPHGSRHVGQHRHDGFGRISINERQQRQHQRIVQGVRSGELTPLEARNLRREQRGIRHMERRYLADGHLSPREWRHLDHALDEASRNIWHQKHDRQSRY